jgi:hypothetical protein
MQAKVEHVETEDKEDLTAFERWILRHLRCQQCKRLRVFGFFSSSAKCPGCRRDAARAFRAQQEDLTKRLSKALLDGFTKPGGTDANAVQHLLEQFTQAGLHDTLPSRVKTYEALVSFVIEQGKLTDENERAISNAKRIMQLSNTDGDVGDFEHYLQRQKLIVAIQQGQLPAIESPVPLQKNETAHFCFDRVYFLQDRAKREYVGGSSGVSFRVARGVYYHVGSHRGQSISHFELTPIGKGQLILTSMRLIFSGETSFSIPLGKILHFEPFTDAFAVTKDSTAQNNKPFVFACRDPELANVAFSACWNLAG